MSQEISINSARLHDDVIDTIEALQEGNNESIHKYTELCTRLISTILVNKRIVGLNDSEIFKILEDINDLSHMLSNLKARV